MKKIIYILVFVLSLSLIGNAAKYKVCPNGHKNPITAKYCIYCGLKLNDKIIDTDRKKIIKPKLKKKVISKTEKKEKTKYKLICPNNINHKVKSEKQKFCIICGAKLVKVKMNAFAKKNKKQSVKKIKVIKKKNNNKKKLITHSTPKSKSNIKVDLLLTKAMTAFKEKNLYLSMSYYKKAYNIAPDNPDVLYNCGTASYYLKNYEDAINFFNKLLKKKADYDALFYLGLSYYRLGDNDNAKIQWLLIKNNIMNSQAKIYKLALKYLNLIK